MILATRFLFPEPTKRVRQTPKVSLMCCLRRLEAGGRHVFLDS